ncbi:SGNH/GDSL hydrolase family protein [Legionella dresdenensis]|uniref:SGNH/GDSL hydrolase family protein n=1 Tax=Legionella dresdenensis TaxID=450200 RepID=A0ABV8CDU7_9GAMM
MKKLLILWMAVLLSFGARAYDNRFDNMVIFGDSLSDNGNLYRYLWHLLPVSPPYFEGHFANGQVWVEYLYDSYFPDGMNQRGFQDYAVGGAGAVLSYKQNLPFTLGIELNDYFYWHTYGRQETSLYTLWIGANNYINGPTNVENITDRVVDAISEGVERLIAHGGNKFIIANLPDLARLPQASNSSHKGLLTELTLTHNRKLEALIKHLKVKHADCLFIYFDAYTLFNESIDHASDFGFFNTTEPCYLGSYSGWLAELKSDDETLYESLKQRSPQMTEEQWQMIRNNPQLREAALAAYWYSLLPRSVQDEPSYCEGYVFWDQVHPTTAVHKMIAEKVAQLISETDLQAVLPDVKAT